MVFFSDSRSAFSVDLAGEKKMEQPWVGWKVHSAAFQTASPPPPQLLAMLPSLKLQKHAQHTHNIYVRSNFFAIQKLKRPKHLKKRRRTCCRAQRVHPPFATVQFLRGQFSPTGCRRWMLTQKVTCIGNVFKCLKKFFFFFFHLFFSKLSQGWVCLFYPTLKLYDPWATLLPILCENITFSQPSIIFAISIFQYHITSQYHCIYYHFFW